MARSSSWSPISVARAGLCIGCGLCAAVLPNKVGIGRDNDGFHVPFPKGTSLTKAELEQFARYCPGLGYRPPEVERNATNDPLWGPVRNVYQAWARDDHVRFVGSSGGALSAMLSTMLSSGDVDAVLVLGATEEDPLENGPRLISDPSMVASYAGSRYAPGAPTSGLADLDPDLRIAVVGKPCDIAGLRAALEEAPSSFPAVVALLSFFCAGQPAMTGTRELLNRLECQEGEVAAIRYRGHGWPGAFHVTLTSGAERELSYAESWGGTLNRYLHHRCKTCIDSVGHMADVVAADSWDVDDTGLPSFGEAEGRSAIIVRTAVGEAVVSAAVGGGALGIEPLDIAQLKAVQAYQVERRKMAAARAIGFRLARVAAPRWPGYSRLRWLLNHPSVALKQAWGSYRRGKRADRPREKRS